MHKPLLLVAIALSVLAPMIVCLPPAEAALHELHEGTYLTDQDTSKMMLKEKGYSDIRMIGFDLNGEVCGKYNLYIDKFSATAPNGKPVQGFICGDRYPEIKLLRYVQ